MQEAELTALGALLVGGVRGRERFFREIHDNRIEPRIDGAHPLEMRFHDFDRGDCARADRSRGIDRGPLPGRSPRPARGG
ncbi:hypothetical protein GCM10007858_76300 [Bradyrhizobium liaoningense]|nr:hypothetical protein GCM10007858_76300 [Bradyrhizobium liaoningense]